MKKLLLFSEGNFHKAYQSWLTKYRIRKEFVSLIQIIILGILILFCLVMFLIFVNKSSTEGYFLRQANNKLSNVNFNNEIMKTQILDLRRSNRDKLTDSDLYGPSINLLDANIESIQVPQS
ncbi:MAG: hypothetical protein PHU61_02875 [Candidatus Absconditabacteria bacterium]|nr:hypothetical protein [Candidatus Absconditabacteria bacterium]MDD3868275.1 hypothetical protein [Candidatus Absconditabacteria bacterium]MDD4714597.1 hypothetical protein [Candidatus Absconditabacteria bacterium]